MPSVKKKMKKTTRRSVRRNECRPGNSSRRLQTFGRRRNGLFKKAHQLSNRCNAEVAAIVISPSGNVSEFASSSMSHILKRYQSFQPQMPSNNVLVHDVKRWKHEAISLNSILKDSQELGRFLKNTPSSINVIQSFESILVQTLNEIYKRKMELLEVESQKLVQQGETLFEENTMLKEKLIQSMPTKECRTNSIHGSEDFSYHQQDNIDTNFRHGLDMLQCSEEEDSKSSQCLV